MDKTHTDRDAHGRDPGRVSLVAREQPALARSDAAECRDADPGPRGASWALLSRLLTAAACGGVVLCAVHRPSAPFLGLIICCGLLVAAILLQHRAARQLALLQAGWTRATRLAELNGSIVHALAVALDARHQHAQGHTQRVRELALRVGDALGLSADDRDALGMAAMLHDVGELAIPDYLLSKPDRLTEEEMCKVRTHALVGTALLESAHLPWPVAPIIRGHHEWYDGSGYPDGLVGEAIPIGARILAVADVYDALLSRRPYRAPLPVREALALLKERSGSQFDPDVLKVGLRVLDRVQPAQGPLFAYGGGNAQGSKDEPASFYQEIQRANREMAVLYDVAQSVGRSLDVQETLALVIDKTRETTGAHTCVLFLRQDGDFLLAAAASGAFADRLEGRQLPLGRGLSGTVCETGLPSGLHRLAQEDLDLLPVEEPWTQRLAHALSVPLASERGCLGALTLYRATEVPFSEDDARLAATVAKQAAAAVSNAYQFEQTQESALRDGLTGIANARCFHLRLGTELARARQRGRLLSLIAIDLDGLKYVNDTHGHQEGDRLLCAAAATFAQGTRAEDLVARYAGDEFFIILPGLPHREAWELQHRLKDALRATTLETASGEKLPLRASFGTATFPGDAQDAESLIAAADQVMYEDKRLNHQALLLRAAEAGSAAEAALAEHVRTRSIKPASPN